MPNKSQNTASAGTESSRRNGKAHNTPPPDVYAADAPTYWDAGWRGVLPLPARAKAYPPKTYTGRDGVDPSYPDLLQWCELRADGNIGLRLPPGVIGIDVDHYGDKTGGHTLAEAEKRWGALPATVRSTSRDDGVSGIRLYRIPEGVEFAGVLTLELDDGTTTGGIEIIQFHHRYVVAWPSIHPSGAVYQWIDADGEIVGIPDPADLPELPAEWVKELGRAAPASRNGVNGVAHNGVAEPFDATEAMTAGAMSIAVKARLADAIIDCQKASGDARHDATRDAVLALLHLGKDGESGVMSALLALRDQFVAAVGPDRKGGAAEATAEFNRMVNSERVAKLLADSYLTLPGPSPINGTEVEDDIDDIDDDEPESLNLPAEFWESRPYLARIRDIARERMVPADALLGAVLVEVSGHMPITVRVDTGIRKPVPLHLFAGLTGDSGAVKSSAISLARDVVKFTRSQACSPFDATQPLGDLIGPLDDIAPRRSTLASGQGIAEMYWQGTGANRARTSNPNVIAASPEALKFVKEHASPTSTVPEQVRSMWSGEDAGESNARRENYRPLAAGTYTLAIVAGFVLGAFARLLTTELILVGTPQRWCLFWCADPDAELTPESSTPLSPLVVMIPTEPLTLCDSLRRRIRLRQHEQVRTGRSTVGELESQRDAMLARLAGLLVVLDTGREDRVTVTEEDWALAETIFATSLRIMRECQRAGRQAEATRKADQRADRVNDAVAVSTATKGSPEDKMAERLRAAIMTSATREDSGGGRVRAKWSGKDGVRKRFDADGRVLAEKVLSSDIRFRRVDAEGSTYVEVDV